MTPPSVSEQPKRLEAGDAFAPDDQMVVYCDAQRPAGLDDLACHVDVGRRRGRIARRMIVQEPMGPSKTLNYIRKLSRFGVGGDVDWGALATALSFDTVPGVFSHRRSPVPTLAERFLIAPMNACATSSA